MCPLRGFPRGGDDGIGGATEVGAMEEELYTMIVESSLENYVGSFDFEIRVVSNPGEVELVRSAKFLGPDPRLLDKDFLERYETDVR